MPVIKSAKKKLRQDKKRTLQNGKQESALKELVKAARKNPTDKTVQSVQKAADKAVKKHLLHKNKAARLKSSLAKLLSGKGTPQVVSKVKKQAIKKQLQKNKTTSQ